MSDEAPGRKKPEKLADIAWSLRAIVRKCDDWLEKLSKCDRE
jgi:hypothetical protein